MAKDYEMSPSDAVADATGEHAPEGSKEDVKQDAKLKAKRDAMQDSKCRGCEGDMSRAVAHLKRETER